MLEDTWEDVYLIEYALKKEKFSFESFVVDTEEGFTEGIKTFNPDIVLSDHSLSQFNSVEALKLSKKLCPQVPFILVTGTVSEDFAVTILKKGAQDYILKGNLVGGASYSDGAETEKNRAKKSKSTAALT